MERIELRWVRSDGRGAVVLKWFHKTAVEASEAMDRIAALMTPDQKEEET